MSTLNIEQVREELCNTLRSNDVFSITLRGVTTKTDTLTATAGQTILNLTFPSVHNIRSLTVNATPYSLFKDYTINWTTGVITMNVGLTLADAVIVIYDYGATDKIYPDFPREDISLKSYPRIGIQLVGTSTEPLGLGGMVHISDLMITIGTWMPVNKDSDITGALGGTNDMSVTLSKIRDVIRANAKSFYTFKYIYPSGTTPIMSSTNNKIIQQGENFIIKFVVENN